MRDRIASALSAATPRKVARAIPLGPGAAGDRWRQLALALVPATVAFAWYLKTQPPAPDLAAQVARASISGATGVGEWWMGWFGGLQLPSYSVIAPPVMHVLSTRAVGAIAVIVAVLAMASLLRDTRRPAAGTAVFALLAVADVAAGRLTFALAFAVSLVCLRELRERRWWCIPIAVLCGLTSLLAALFLGVAVTAVALTDSSRRRYAGITAAVILAVGVAEAVLFPQTGSMPYGLWDMLGAAVTAFAVAVFVPHRTMRVGALLMTALPLAVMLDPGAIGENAVRLSWVVGAPLIVACASTSRRAVVVLFTLGAAAWPTTNTILQLAHGADRSSQASFYLPLQRQLASQFQAAGPAVLGERVEIVPTRTHWETAYLINQVQLARGWDRQADVADNSIFYTDGALTPATYEHWLSQLAVGWVALPHAPLDAAGLGEAALVDSHPTYLKHVWSDSNWDLYKVVPATPLASGADVVSETASSVRLHFDAARTALVRVRWSPYLTATTADGDTHSACASPTPSGFTTISVAHPGDVVLSSDFRLGARTCRPPA